MKKRNLTNYLPPGARVSNHMTGLLVGWLIYVVWSAIRYCGLLKSQIFYTYLWSNAQQPDQTAVVDSTLPFYPEWVVYGVLVPFLVLLLAAGAWAVRNQRGLSGESHSEYLLRRLPDRRELRRRYFTFPGLLVLVGLVLIPVMAAAFYGVYRYVVPDPNMTPEMWDQLFRDFPQLFVP